MGHLYEPPLVEDVRAAIGALNWRVGLPFTPGKD
jgi:hypothetical protein